MHLLDLISTLQTPYCEHLGLRSFTEPINAISNLAFLFAVTRPRGKFMSYPKSAPAPGCSPGRWRQLRSAVFSTILSAAQLHTSSISYP